MSEYEMLAEALCKFLGRTDITAEMLTSFDDLEFNSPSSDFRFKLQINPLTGDYECYISEYFDGILDRWFRTAEILEMENYLNKVAEVINDTQEGLSQLMRLSGTVAVHGDELDIKVGFNYASSYYVIFWGNENFTTRRSYEAAEKLSSILDEGMQKWIDAVNEKLADYRVERIEWNKNFEFYLEGLYLSIYYTGINKSIVSFHPSKNPLEWLQTKCDSRRKLNEALSEVYRRLA